MTSKFWGPIDDDESTMKKRSVRHHLPSSWGGQEHSNEPTVFAHACEHPPLSLKHSSKSVFLSIKRESQAYCGRFLGFSLKGGYVFLIVKWQLVAKDLSKEPMWELKLIILIWYIQKVVGGFDFHFDGNLGWSNCERIMWTIPVSKHKNPG